MVFVGDIVIVAAGVHRSQSSLIVFADKWFYLTWLLAMSVGENSHYPVIIVVPTVENA